MRAVSLFKAWDMRLVDLPSPLIERNDQVRLKVAAVGLCGSDLHYYKDGHIGAGQTIDQPFTPGHEFSGHLIDDLPELGLHAGALVAVDPNISCGECEWCRRDEENLCPKPDFIGAPPHNGALCEEIVVETRRIVALPGGIDAVQAAMLEPLGVCIHSLDLARPQWWETVAVVGCGPIGLGIIQLLHNAGIRHIHAIEPVDYRRAKASGEGAEAVHDAVAGLIEATDGRGADLVIEATNSPDGFEAATRTARIGGRAVIVGIPDGNSYSFEASPARRKQLTITFSRRMNHVYPRAIELVARRGLKPETLVTHKIALAGVPNAFDMLSNHEDGAIKVIVEPNR
jgi:L-iditol 2-dehydrogenase